MPIMWIKAHIEALSELQGEESFRGAEVISIGTGKLNKREHEKVIKRWNSAVGRDYGTRIKDKNDISRLKAFGIEVHDGSR